jgi:cytochrome P450
MLVRCARDDFEVGGKQIHTGDRLLMIYASANRDEMRFERADEFDIFRPRKADMTFGIGVGFCLGAHLAQFVGPMMVEEILNAIGDYELIEDQCERAFGENLAGFNRVPIRFRPPAA